MTDIRLVPLTLEDAYNLIPLRNDPEVQEHLRHPDIVGRFQQEQWWEYVQVHHNTNWMRKIQIKEHTINWLIAGCGGLTDIDWINRRAELSVYTVPPNYELRAAHLILHHGFNDLGLHRIEAETLTGGRERLVQDLGFTCEGRRRDSYWRNGQFITSARWGLIAENYIPMKDAND